MIRFIYILAASHSGSTLLTMLLNAHPDVATVGSLGPGGIGDINKYRCSCGSLIRECSFWNWLTNRAKANGIPFCVEHFGTRFNMRTSKLGNRLLSALHRGPMFELIRDTCLNLLTPWPRRFQQIARANEVLVKLIMEYYSSKVFVDKGNIALRLKYLLRIPSFDIKVIHLVRDGRGVALSYMDPAVFADARDPALRGGGMGGNRENERLSMKMAATEWKRSVEEAEFILSRLDKSRWITIKYESLCTEPDTTMNRIFEFIGLDPSKRAKDFRSVEHHILGNGMRLDSTSEIQLDERWKSVLTPEQLAIFDRIAGRINEHFRDE